MTYEEFEAAVYQLSRDNDHEYIGFGLTIKPRLLNPEFHNKCCGHVCPEIARIPETIAHFFPDDTGKSLEQLIQAGQAAEGRNEIHVALLSYGTAIMRFRDRTAIENFQKLLSTMTPSIKLNTTKAVRKWLDQPFSNNLSNTDVILLLWLGNEQKVRQLKKIMASSTHDTFDAKLAIIAYFLGQVGPYSLRTFQTLDWIRTRLKRKYEF